MKVATSVVVLLSATAAERGETEDVVLVGFASAADAELFLPLLIAVGETL